MKGIRHPSEYIAPEYVEKIRDTAGESEQLKQLHPAQLEIIYGQKWIQLFVPKIHHGPEFSLPDALRLEEALAWADGSLGWTVTLCAGAGWFIGFLDPDLIPSVFNDYTLCIAGSGKAAGIAKKIANGYEISGYWNYATGAAHATAFTANCVMEENGVPLKNPDGSPAVQAFLFLRDEVTVHENWNSMGLIATGSHSFEVRNVRVKKNRAFRIDRASATLPHPIYQYPFRSFAETTLAVNSSGMAVRFLDLCEILFSQKENDAAPVLLENARKQLNQARQLFYETAESSWQECIQNRTIPPLLLDLITHASRRLARSAREVVDALYPCCGLQAADPGKEINRVWRNLHTASQHQLLNGCDPVPVSDPIHRV